MGLELAHLHLYVMVLRYYDRLLIVVMGTILFSYDGSIREDPPGQWEVYQLRGVVREWGLFFSCFSTCSLALLQGLLVQVWLPLAIRGILYFIFLLLVEEREWLPVAFC